MEIQGSKKAQLEEFKKYCIEKVIFELWFKIWTEIGTDGKPVQVVDIRIYEKSFHRSVRTSK